VSAKQKQSEVYTVTYDISQDIVATVFMSGETYKYNIITNSLLSLL